ncbi:hypothetical protein F2P45_28455 [Massilia sp. CCM 8733]|uniref:Uncharacterized protein n=1 Tax=Massilia mucilaginosa TaxID=2609282 RepID=A0ABX0P287_9BURK|nr:hypothetical protein [Massilia mucilaginosa]NHZ92910.1 hypothetical protein [Massilia mucilaginosa]
MSDLYWNEDIMAQASVHRSVQTAVPGAVTDPGLPVSRSQQKQRAGGQQLPLVKSLFYNVSTL